MKRLRKSKSTEADGLVFDERKEKKKKKGKEERRGHTNREGAQPRIDLFLITVQSSKHHARMLACQIILRLTHVQRNVTRPLPEFE